MDDNDKLIVGEFLKSIGIEVMMNETAPTAMVNYEDAFIDELKKLVDKYMEKLKHNMSQINFEKQSREMFQAKENEAELVKQIEEEKSKLSITKKII